MPLVIVKSAALLFDTEPKGSNRICSLESIIYVCIHTHIHTKNFVGLEEFFPSLQILKDNTDRKILMHK